MKFEIKDRDACARIGKLHTEHGIITTPTLLPVINPNKIIISPREMKKRFTIEMVITNSYIIRKHEDLKKIALEKGVHNLIDFDGPIMTDSGTFQSYVYGSVDVTPTEIIEFQKNIGVDIGTILDVFGTPQQTKKEAEEGMNETIKRAKLSVPLKEKMGIALPVQGSIYPDLRKTCAEELSKLDADLFPIGGVVPLMENQRYSDLVQIILASKKGLNPSKPVHLFGAGHPLIFPLATALGCDLFDSAAYVKYAKENRYILSNGTIKLGDLDELPCVCPACSKYTINELKKLNQKERMKTIAEHNLFISMLEIKKIRNAIRNGKLWELVEQKASENPYLYEAMNILKQPKEKQWLEQFEILYKKKALFYTGPHTIHQPLLSRIHQRLLENYTTDKKIVVIFPENTKPYNITYNQQINEIKQINPSIDILIDSALGPIPLFLDEMYPFAQSVFPKITDTFTQSYTQELLKKITKNKQIFYWKGKQTLLDLEQFKDSKNTKINSDIQRILAVATIQFGKKAGQTLFSGEIRIVKSKKTEKIRNVYSNEEHMVSMRASDGMFTLKIEGGKRLHKQFSSPRYRIIIHDDAVPFIKDGKSVFSKFVLDGDEKLRPFDECIIVDKNDQYLGVGRCILNLQEMKAFTYGQAVKLREHVHEK